MRLDSAAAILKGGPTAPPSSRKAWMTAYWSNASLSPSRRAHAAGGRASRAGGDRRDSILDRVGREGPGGKEAPRDPRDHWSFRPPVRSSVPGATAGVNPIDSFLGVEHRRIGLTPLPRADKAELLRRVHARPDRAGPYSARCCGPSSPTPPRTLMRRPSIACSPARNTANGGAGTGWTLAIQRLGRLPPRSARVAVHLAMADWIVESSNRPGYDRMIVLMLAADEAATDDRIPRSVSTGSSPGTGTSSAARLARRRRRTHGQGIPGPDDRLCPLSRPQV